MKSKTFALAVAFAVGLASVAAAQTWRPFGFGFGNSGGSIAVVTSCNAGQLDWSDATGCNLTLYMVGLK